MARTNNLTNFLTDVANAIRTKKGTESQIQAANFDTEIASIETATIEATKAVTPSTFAQTIEPSAGYDAMAEVTVAAVTNAIDANIQASNIKSGITILGVQGNLAPDKPDQTKTCTPTTSQQVIEPDTGYELASVTVNGVTSDIDSNIAAGNIKNGISILGIEGTYTGIDTSDATAAATDIASGRTAYVNGTKITGTVTEYVQAAGHSSQHIVISGDNTVDTSNNSVSIAYTVSGTSSGGELFRNGSTFGAGVSNTVMASAINLTAAKIAQGETILGVTGTYDGGVAAALGGAY